MTDKEILQKYLPENSVDTALYWLRQHKVRFNIANNRTTKHGDYRPPINYPIHRISVNHDLNKYAFLITFVHEMAHLKVWEKYNYKVKPHGNEWKKEYRELMKVMIDKKCFPCDVEEAINNSLITSKASSSSDIDLVKALRKYDEFQDILHLEDLEKGEIFALDNGKVFRKGDLRRTRYLCSDFYTDSLYAIHSLAPVQRVKVKK